MAAALVAVPELDRMPIPPPVDLAEEASATSTLQLAMAGTGDGNSTPRVANELSVLQEEALVGLIYESFVVDNNCTHLDYEKVKRFAVTIQTDEEVCATLSTTALDGEDDCWVPSDDWLTDMCKAFKKSYEEHVAMTERQAAPPVELTARSKVVSKIKDKKSSALKADSPKLSSRTPSGKTSNRPRSASPKPASKKAPGSARGSSPAASARSERKPLSPNQGA
uniref:Uncharacterized protein n=1 Tax=Haptolina brevifila TaxID=156173 RepID=A0A7S2CP38_9EUKA